MDLIHKWKRLKYWQQMLRRLEEEKRRRIIDALERQISNKKAELEERTKKAADEKQINMQDIEKREKQLREKRKQFEIERIIHFDMENKN